ncbi:hypothetical protein ACFSTC_62985 [Nonomuraea ferruginea]
MIAFHGEDADEHERSTGDGQATGQAGRSLTELLGELPALDEATVVHSTSSTLTLAELRAAVSRVAKAS